MQFLSCGGISKLTPKNCPQKLLIIGPQLFFYVLAWLPKQPKSRNRVPQKAP